MAEENPLPQHAPHFQLHGVYVSKISENDGSAHSLSLKCSQVQLSNHKTTRTQPHFPGEGSTQMISAERLLWWTSCFSHKFSCEASLQSCLTYSRGTGSLLWSILFLLQDLLLPLKSNLPTGLSEKCIRGHTENLDPGTLLSCLVNVHSSQPLEFLQMGANLHPLLSRHLQIF